jgi:cohesin loading factor subunit SCC2
LLTAIFKALIPPFLALPRSSPAAFEDQSDVQAVRKELEQLSMRARTADEASKRCQRTIRDVQKLLNPDNLTQLKFKCAKRTISRSNGHNAAPAKAVELSPFAKMVFDNTETPFVRYRSADEHTSRAPSKVLVQNVSAPVQNTAVPVKQKLKTEAQAPIEPRPQAPQAVVQLDVVNPAIRSEYERISTAEPLITRPIAVVQPTALAENPVVPPVEATTPVPSRLYVIPKSLTPAQREQYEFIPTSSIPLDPVASKQTPTIPRLSADQQRQAAAAVENLQSQLQAIFEAEDHMQPDTSGEAPVRQNHLFGTCDVQGSSVSVLRSRAQDELDTATAKVVSAGRLCDIEVESLLRAQRVCEAAISAITSTSLQINEDWSDEDTNEWLKRIATVKSGLVAARTMTRIMVGAFRFKETQSEDNVKAVLYALRWVIDGCIIPVVGERPMRGEKSKGDRDGPPNRIFAIAAENRADLQGLIKGVQKCLRLLGDLFSKTNIDESGISSAELMCRTLIFGDNAPTEKESALGLAVFENMRRSSMDLVAKIFTKYTGQREYIIDQILQSLEKLPPTKQNARQFALIDAKPIQLVSALLMRLVQTSAMAGADFKAFDDDASADEDESATEESDDDSSDEDGPRQKKGRKSKKMPNAKQRDDLASTAKELYNAAQLNATEIVGTLLRRALSTTKSSDEPFRKLLDIFTEDFINVLTSSDWPSGELLLRKLVGQMFGIAENPKSPAPSKSLALELLGTIGSAILDVRMSTQEYAKSIDTSDPISQRLAAMASSLADGTSSIADLTSFDGPYRVVIEYLHARGDTDAHLQTARGYHLVQWAEHLNSKDMPSSDTTEMRHLKRKILNMIYDPLWLEEDPEYANVTTSMGKLAAKIVTSRLLLCRAFPRMLSILLKSMTSEQSTIRSRAIKSVTNLLEKSPNLLDSEVHLLESILRATRDKSSLVRDSAMILIEKCVSLQPSLAARVNTRVIERTTDASALIRKRAIKFLKQLYSMIKDTNARAVIANAVICRVADSEESVAEVALNTIEEIWFSGFGESKNGIDVSIQLREQVSMIIKTVDSSEAVVDVLEGLVRRISTKSASASESHKACKAFVATLFDGVIDSSDIPGSPQQWAILRTLTIFAKAAPKLFSANQLERLEPYAKNLNSQDDLRVFQHVITIFRYTFPYVTAISHVVLRNLQESLLKSVQRIPSSELATVAPCLAAIADVLDNTGRLVSLTRSALKAVGMRTNVDLATNPAEARKVERLLYIIGHFGKACDFESHLALFQSATDCPGFKGDSVSAYMVMLSCRFTSPKHPHEVRVAALSSICAVCHRCPTHFLREDVLNAFKMVFADNIQELEQVLLSSIANFFSAQEKPEDDGSVPQLGTGIESGTERLGNTYQATGLDSAFGVLAQTFLEDFLRIALASQDDVAMSAARIVVSINRQGRATPRQSGYCLVALETCPNPVVAKMAFLEHKSQYSKHEGTFESDLPRSLEKTFQYQCNLSQDITGCTGQPPVSKLHFLWEVLKTGKAKVRAKLFTSMCSKIAFDPSSFVPSSPMPERLQSARFSVEAMAYLEFERGEEVHHLLTCLEKTFSTTGTPVAQAIETEVQQLLMPDVTSSIEVNPAEMTETAPNQLPQHIDPARLQQLAVFSQILSLLFETHSFLRRAWSMHKYKGKPKKGSAKDAATKAIKAPNYTALADSYQNRINKIYKVAVAEVDQRAICNAFAETFKRDDEVKVGSDEDGDTDMDNMIDDARSDTASERSGSQPLGTPRKRKRSVGPSGQVRKKFKARSASDADEDDYDG